MDSPVHTNLYRSRRRFASRWKDFSGRFRSSFQRAPMKTLPIYALALSVLAGHLSAADACDPVRRLKVCTLTIDAANKKVASVDVRNQAAVTILIINKPALSTCAFAGQTRTPVQSKSGLAALITALASIGPTFLARGAERLDP